MTSVGPTETVYIDYKDPQKTEACSLKFKTRRFEEWVACIADNYNSDFECQSDKVIRFQIDRDIRVTIKCHPTTGLILIQGADILKWHGTDFPCLQNIVNNISCVSDIESLLTTRNLMIVNSPADGHCLLHSICTAYNAFDPSNQMDINAVVAAMRSEITNNLPKYAECYDTKSRLLSELDKYVNEMTYDLLLVDMAPQVLSNALHYQIDVVAEDDNGKCTIYHLKPNVASLGVIAVYLKSAHYSALVTKPHTTPTNTAHTISSMSDIFTPARRSQRQKTQRKLYPGYVQYGDSLFHSLDEVTSDQGSPGSPRSPLSALRIDCSSDSTTTEPTTAEVNPKNSPPIDVENMAAIPTAVALLSSKDVAHTNGTPNTDDDTATVVPQNDVSTTDATPAKDLANDHETTCIPNTDDDTAAVTPKNEASTTTDATPEEDLAMAKAHETTCTPKADDATAAVTPLNDASTTDATPAEDLAMTNDHKATCDKMSTSDTTSSPEVTTLQKPNPSESQNTGTTLLIGSSQLKHIKTKWLRNTLVQTMRGARVLDVYGRLSTTTLKPYRNIILQIGSNDLDRRPQMVILEFKLLLDAIKLNAAPESNIFIGSIPPRADSKTKEAIELNKCLSNLAMSQSNVQFINHEAWLSDPSHLSKDRYHISRTGTQALLQSMDRYVHFLKPDTEAMPEAYYPRKRCFNCGEDNHLRNECRFNFKIRCHQCHELGHKRKMCQRPDQTNIAQNSPNIHELEHYPPLPKKRPYSTNKPGPASFSRSPVASRNSNSTMSNAVVGHGPCRKSGAMLNDFPDGLPQPHMPACVPAPAPGPPLQEVARQFGMPLQQPGAWISNANISLSAGQPHYPAALGHNHHGYGGHRPLHQNIEHGYLAPYPTHIPPTPQRAAGFYPY